MTPRVSVLMPAYNAERTITQAVASALAQSVSDLELIVTDDGSAVPVARALEPVRDERLRVLRTIANRGVASARNAALAAARAPIVAQLDADDRWHESHLDGLLPAFADPGVGLAYTNAEIEGHPEGYDRWIGEWAGDPRSRRAVTERRLHPVNDLAVLYEGNPIPSPGVAMRTAAARAAGGYPPWLTVGEDYFLYLKLLRAGWRFSYVDRASAVYRWPQPGRGATFDRRRAVRQQAKLYAALALSAPGEPVISLRLARELAEVVATHVPGSLAAWRLARAAHSRARSERR